MLVLLACHPDPATILGPDPTSRSEVRVLEARGERWVPRSEAIAHGFSSLHAVTWGDELVVVGLRADPPTAWEERFPSLFVDALVTRDGERWAARRYDVDAPGRSLIDPAIVAGPDGMELWFARAAGTGDPARRPTEIVRTRWDGARFGDAEVWFAGEGFVDPAPVREGGRWEVWATSGARDVVRIVDGRVETALAGATVPSGDGLAQRMVDGRMSPVHLDGAPLPISWPPDMRTCASPVNGEVAGKHLLLCVDERGGGWR